MYILEIIGLLLFFVLTILGYRKNNRNIMLVASLCLMISLAAPDFITGFIAGFNGK